MDLFTIVCARMKPVHLCLSVGVTKEVRRSILLLDTRVIPALNSLLWIMQVSTIQPTTDVPAYSSWEYSPTETVCLFDWVCLYVMPSVKIYIPIALFDCNQSQILAAYSCTMAFFAIYNEATTNSCKLRYVDRWIESIPKQNLQTTSIRGPILQS